MIATQFLLLSCFILGTLPHQSNIYTNYLYLESVKPESIFNVETSQQYNGSEQMNPLTEKLLYLTPWTYNEGLELALKYMHKFDYIVLCWYDVLFEKDKIIFEGQVYHNKTLLGEIRAKNKDIKILIRLNLASSAKGIIQCIGSMESKVEEAGKAISSLINRLSVDGAVIDSQHNVFYKKEKWEEHTNANKIASLLIFQLVNSIKALVNGKKELFYSLPNPFLEVVDLDYERLALLKVDGFLVQALDNIYYEEMAIQASSFINELRSMREDCQFFVILPFFSRRQNQGIRTLEVKKALFKNGVNYRGIKNGVCAFTEQDTKILSYVPCIQYFKKMFDLALDQHFSLGFWEAGSGLQKYFKFL